MKVCAHCRTDIPDYATTCPNCLEDPYDPGTMIWGWLFVIGCIVLAFTLFF